MPWRALLLALTLACLSAACSEAPASLPTEAQTPPFSWDLYFNTKRMALRHGSELWLVRRSEHLEHVYALSQGSQAEPETALARTLFQSTEIQFSQAGVTVANQVTSLRCAAVDLPDCYPQWRFLDDLLGPGSRPAARRLRKALTDSFDATARQRRMENTLRLSILNVMMAGGMVKAVVGKAAAAEVRAAAASKAPAAAVGAERLATGSGRLRVTPEVSAIQARLVEAEAQVVGPRHTAVVENLARLRPSLQRPPAGIAADDALWRDYVAYWERRFTELTAQGHAANVRPPLTWSSYHVFRTRFGEALKFQREVTATLRQEVALPRQERRMLRDMEKPRVEEDVGLAHEGPSRTYADQLVVDEASLGRSAPRVETFSTKQRDFTRLNRGESEKQVQTDALEALAKYGGEVEVRRPGHPLFERRVTVYRVHLVYDGRRVPHDRELRRFMEIRAQAQGVELHFHAP